MEVEAREYGAASEVPAIAEAMVIQTLAHRILARFYTSFNKKSHPLKVFMNRDKAVEWLAGF